MSRNIGIRPWVDFAFRKIFGKPGNDICLISLLNSVLRLPYPIQSVEYQNPFSLKDYFDDKLVCVDVKARDALGRVFVVEIQVWCTLVLRNGRCFMRVLHTPISLEEGKVMESSRRPFAFVF